MVVRSLRPLQQYYQTVDGECAFGAIQAALALRGTHTTIGALQDKLRRAGLRRLPVNGLFISQVGYLIKECGFEPQILLPYTFLPEIFKHLPRPVATLTLTADLVLMAFRRVRPAQGRFHNYLALYLLVASRTNILIRGLAGRPNVLDLLSSHDIVIANISGREYYGIPRETWRHYLVLFRRGKDIQIFDCYRKLGFTRYGQRWPHFLRQAAGFEWSDWCGPMIGL